jgi:hypothetical protein
MVNSSALKWVFMATFCMSHPMSQARTVQKIVIEKVGLNRDTGDSNLTEGCKSFKPTLAQVKRYFSKAYPVEGYVVSTERYSPCYATGEITFNDNSSGRFRLDSGGTATLYWSRGDIVHLLYKRNGWSDPFECTYGLSSEPEC